VIDDDQNRFLAIRGRLIENSVPLYRCEMCIDSPVKSVSRSGAVVQADNINTVNRPNNCTIIRFRE
jgi:hypothetical protein